MKPELHAHLVGDLASNIMIILSSRCIPLKSAVGMPGKVCNAWSQVCGSKLLTVADVKASQLCIIKSLDCRLHGSLLAEEADNSALSKID